VTYIESIAIWLCPSLVVIYCNFVITVLKPVVGSSRSRSQMRIMVRSMESMMLISLMFFTLSVIRHCDCLPTQ